MKFILNLIILVSFLSCTIRAAEIGHVPRRFHYDFAHKLLPLMFLHDNPEFDQKIQSDGSKILSDLWDSHLKKHSLTKEEYPITIDSLKTNGLHIVVISLPTPEHITEAHMVACVFLKAGGKSYYTLEQSVSFEPGASANVFGEWTRDGSRLNLGEGPVAEVDKFIEVIRMKEQN